MAAFDCPNCKKPSDKLVIYESPKKFLGCPACGIKKATRYNVHLGQVVDVYPRKDGTTGKITYGKNWEINNRGLSPDGRVINTKTGKDAQY